MTDILHEALSDSPRWFARHVATAAIVIGATVGCQAWIAGHYVSREEMLQHTHEDAATIERLSASDQERKASAEAASLQLADIKTKLAGIEADLAWLKAYLADRRSRETSR